MYPDNGEKCKICKSSVGAYIILHYIHDHPEEIRRIGIETMYRDEYRAFLERKAERKAKDDANKK